MRNVEIGHALSLADLEQRLAELPAGNDAPAQIQVRIEIDPRSDILTDIWTAILCGTACRRATTDVTLAASDEDAAARFSTSLAGLTCASMAASIRSAENMPLDVADLKQRLMLVNEGLVSPDSDVTQTMVEFDPDYPVSPSLRRADGGEAEPRLRRQLFVSQVLRFRQLLDLGALRRGSGPVSAGPAGDVGQFLAELHENGFEHGVREGGRRLCGTRFLRIRTHAASDPTELLENCGPFRQLRHYVDRTFHGADPVTLIEASISDFGPGIVDGFQASPAGMGPDVNRRELLNGLIYGRLSSKGNDPSAGLGIQKALGAAKRMQAFVSLRTAEFWMAASFLADKPDAQLVHLGASPHPSVAGTHWQIFWPHY